MLPKMLIWLLREYAINVARFNFFKMTKVEKILVGKGIRPTEMRLTIYKHLKRKVYAVTLKDMEKAFIKNSDDNRTADRTTIFRTIKLFQEKGIVHQIDDGTAIAKYALSDESDEKGLDLHLHFHCTHCGNTFCLSNKVRRDSLPDNYEITDVNLVLKGVCIKCRKAKEIKRRTDQAAHKNLKNETDNELIKLARCCVKNQSEIS